MKIIKRVKSTSQKVIGKVMNSLSQTQNIPKGEKEITTGMAELSRKLGSEGIVLLKNENKVLPFRDEDTVAVFGRTQIDWFYVGFGSGGDVNPPYYVSLFEGLENAGIRYDRLLRADYEEWTAHPDHKADKGFWGFWPYYYEEMPLKKADVKGVADRTTVAMVVIGRAAGEDRENKLTPGSYYLTEEEKRMLSLVTETFSRVVLVMNCGSIVDLSFTEEYAFDAILYAWQLGMESGNALADVLSGKVNPSGRLTDTVARKYEDYPSADYFGGKKFNNYAEDIYVGYRYFTTFGREKILYPFGYGLSYTQFWTEVKSAGEDKGEVRLVCTVTNTGEYAGKEVIQIYAAPPEGHINKPKRVLCAFQKTGLLAPGETQELSFVISPMDYASYDDHGATEFHNSFVLEKGEYEFFLGGDCLSRQKIFSFKQKQTVQLRQCNEAMNIPRENAFRLLDRHGHHRKSLYFGERDLRKRILSELPEEITPTGDLGIKLRDVKEGKNTLEEFIAQLSDSELSALTRGEGAMWSKQGTDGNAGVFGGYLLSLKEKGTPVITTADGPSGLRVNRYTSLLPCGTSIACTWNVKLVEEVLHLEGEEVKDHGVDILLAPGMNIHRNPLCGRNFEYYSEDPLVSGRIAAAVVRGLQSAGVSACPKHFACNHQEVNRNKNDSRVSMRALREI